jgi:hypothetical protein
MPDEIISTSENEANFSDMDESSINEMTVTHGKTEQPTEEIKTPSYEIPLNEDSGVENTENKEDEGNNDETIIPNNDSIEGNNENQPTEGQVEENESTEEVEDYAEDEDYYYSLTEATGYEIASPDDIVAMAQRLDELEENPYQNLPAEAQMVANIMNNGGDYRNSLRLLSMDTENIGDRDALKESYFLDSKVSSNRELAELQFEKDFDNKYGILDELSKISDPDDRADFETENGRAIKLANLSLEQDVKDARERINGYVDENTTKSPIESISKEEREEFAQNHLNAVKQTVSDFDGITFNFGENGEKEFNLQLTEDQQEGLQNFLANPAGFFREEIGFDLEKADYTDYNSMAALYTLVKNLDNLPNLLGQYYMEQSDRKTVEEIVQNTEKPRTTNSKPQQEGQGISMNATDDFPE